VLGFAAAPWTLASYMVEGKTKEGFATVKSFMYAEPRTFRELLDESRKPRSPIFRRRFAPAPLRSSYLTPGAAN